MIKMDLFSDPDVIRQSVGAVLHLANKVKREKGKMPVFMEVCGSHTMALAKTGIKSRLQNHVELIAGPGCPVCVTDQKTIDAMILLSEGPNRILCTFGDMMRVPGSKYSLLDAKTNGRDIRVVYSPLESIRIAEENTDKEVIFLGIGFETTIPILALLIQEAELRGLNNFSMWMTTKLVEPVLRSLLLSEEIQLDGFILPGHVSVVIGEKSYDFLKKEFTMPAVISGFESGELLSGIYKLLQLVCEDKVEIINDYKYAVKQNGNSMAQQYMHQYFELHDEYWRGIGMIPNSGYALKSEYAKYDAKQKFNVPDVSVKRTKCRCGEIIRGIISPKECVLFSKACTPMHPIGPCMVSTEGTCAAFYQYMRED